MVRITDQIWLVVWNKKTFFHNILGNHPPNWLSYFSEGLKPPTRNCFDINCFWEVFYDVFDVPDTSTSMNKSTSHMVGSLEKGLLLRSEIDFYVCLKFWGRKSNAQLLMLYGFSMERNTQDFSCNDLLAQWRYCIWYSYYICVLQLQDYTTAKLLRKDFVTFSTGQLLENSPFSEVQHSF